MFTQVNLSLSLQQLGCLDPVLPEAIFFFFWAAFSPFKRVQINDAIP